MHFRNTPKADPALHQRGRKPKVGSSNVNPHMTMMCGRVIQSSTPFRLAIVDGLDVRDSRFHNYPPRRNGAPSQELVVIRRNHHTGELSLDPLRWVSSPLV